jgi:hypothetical protein
MSTTTVSRAASAGLTGGVLWALFPAVSSAADMNDPEFGTLAFVAVATSFWIFGVLPPILLVVGLRGLRRTLGADAGRVGAAGVVLSAVGLGAMALGMGIEVASMSVGGEEVSLGHAVLLIGFLVSIVGGVLLGIHLVRRRSAGLSRAAGLLLALALPVGIGIGVLGSAVAPAGDAWFWAAMTVPTGIAWVLLGASLRPDRRPAPAEFAPAS